MIKVYNGSLRLIDWFNPLSEKLPHGDDFRVGPKSDWTPRDNTVRRNGCSAFKLKQTSSCRRWCPKSWRKWRWNSRPGRRSSNCPCEPPTRIEERRKGGQSGRQMPAKPTKRQVGFFCNLRMIYWMKLANSPIFWSLLKERTYSRSRPNSEDFSGRNITRIQNHQRRIINVTVFSGWINKRFYPRRENGPAGALTRYWRVSPNQSIYRLPRG